MSLKPKKASISKIVSSLKKSTNNKPKPYTIRGKDGRTITLSE